MGTQPFNPTPAVLHSAASNGASPAQCFRLMLALALVGFTGCASFKPGAPHGNHFQHRHLHQEDSDFSVTVSVPARPEIKHIFDRALDHKGVQPVWISIENRRDTAAYFLPHELDPDHFAALEVAYWYHQFARPKLNAALDDFFLTNALPIMIPPHSTRSGYVFTHQQLGRKQLKIALAHEEGLQSSRIYRFHAEVPGLIAEHKREVMAELLAQMEPVECDDAQLRLELGKLPRATTSKFGKKEGDPLNLAIIGSVEDLSAFIDCRWTLTERLTFGSAWRTLKSSLFKTGYQHSPISHLYYAGRPQDISFQKVRHSVNLRNHLRLWLTPLRYHGKPVWIGQISRDIGVRWTVKTPNLTTHKINPNVDETRTYLVQDLAPNCRWWSLVKGVEPAPPHAPRQNLTGDPYFTDGLRAVLELTSDAPQPGEPRYKQWEQARPIYLHPLEAAAPQ
jgi:hypothetical protein